MPSIAITRYFICFCLVVFGATTTFAQNVYEGQVVDKETEATIPGVTVKLLKENLATSTNQSGYYKLLFVDAIPTDSLLFTSIGYKPYRMSVSAYLPNMFIVLEATATNLKDVEIKSSAAKAIELHKFGLGDIKYNWYNNPTYPFPYAELDMYAWLMNAPQPNSRITTVKLGRRDFDMYSTAGKLSLPSPYTLFKVHIMSVDEKTGEPADKLFTKDIYLTDNSQMVIIDVNMDNWRVVQKQFFVAVEWSHIPINEIYRLDVDLKLRKMTGSGTEKVTESGIYKVHYQPALVQYRDGRKFSAFTRTIGGKWQQQYHKRSKTNIAISATVIY